MSAVWVIRAGEGGEQQEFALNNGFAVIGWDYLGDMRGVAVEGIKSLMSEKEDASDSRAIPGWAGQTWSFANEVKRGDFVVLPLKDKHGEANRRAAVGEVDGDYAFDAKAPKHCRHRIPVRWLNEDWSMSAIADLPPLRRTVQKVGNAAILSAALSAGYTVVEEGNHVALTLAVNKLIGEGWTPVGGVAVPDGNSVHAYYQSLVKIHGKSL